MPVALHSQEVAAEFVRLASIVASLEVLEERNHVNMSQSRADGLPGEIDIHECTPGQLGRIAELYPIHTPHVDRDNILRYIEVTMAGAVLTFYRR